jgi:hypothetical protein
MDSNMKADTDKLIHHKTKNKMNWYTKNVDWDTPQIKNSPVTE